MATGAGPAGLTAAAAQQREGAAAAGSGPAAPPAGPAAFLSLSAPFSEEGTRRGAPPRQGPGRSRGESGGWGAAGPAGAPERARPGDARRGLWGVLAVPVLSPGVGEAAGAGVSVPLCAPSLLRAGRAEPQGPAGGDRPVPLQKPPLCGGEKTLGQPPPAGPFSAGAEARRDTRSGRLGCKAAR